MPRSPRKKSAYGIYHIMLRGNDRQELFRDDRDYNKFLSIIDRSKQKFGFILYAWCLMPNHVHLLIRDADGSISNAIRSISSSYVSWFNAKYFRTGHLFQGRFLSEPIEDESYFLKVIRYIHLNPVKAKICDLPENYSFSSYNKYFKSGKYTNDDMIFGLIRKDEFEEYHKQQTEDVHEDSEERKKTAISDAAVIRFAEDFTGNKDITAAASLPREKLVDFILSLIESGASIRQINRLTGLSISIILAVSKSK